MFLYCRYLVCLNGLEAIQCPQNFGSFLRFFPCIQVCTMFVYNFYLNLSPLLEAFTTEVLPYFIFLFIIKLATFWISILLIAYQLLCLLNVAKMLCYCRMVYMPMSYLYGKRFVGPITSLILQLREELYTKPYNEVNWKSVRHLCAKVSLS